MANLSNHLLNLMFLFWMLTSLMGCDIKSATNTPVSPEMTPRDVVKNPQLDVTSIGVQDEDKIVFRGETNLPEGECLYSQLYENNHILEWWPSEKCFLVTSNAWSFHVLLGDSGSPKVLDPDAQYLLQVWWDGAPDETRDVIYFDLSAPPSP